MRVVADPVICLIDPSANRRASVSYDGLQRMGRYLLPNRHHVAVLHKPLSESKLVTKTERPSSRTLMSWLIRPQAH